MNKKTSNALTLLAASVMLAACGGNAPSVSSVSTVDTRSSMERFSDGCLAGNLTIDTDGEIVTLFHSDNAFLYDFCEAYEKEYDYVDTGYIGTEQGIFNYVLNEEGKVQLGKCASVTTDAVVADFMKYPRDLVTKISKWKQSSENKNVYTTEDSGLAEVVGSLSGYSDYYTYFKDITLTFAGENNAEHAILSYTLSNVEVRMDFYNFGTTELKFIDEFLESPTRVENPTDFPQEMKDDMNSILSSPLPKYDFSYAINYEHDMQTIEDYGCGDITASYSTKLALAGFVFDANNSRTVKDTKGDIGFIDYLYYRRIFENGTLKAIEYVEVGYTSGYYMDDYYGTDGDYERMYPKGRFGITFVSNDFYNAERYNTFISDLSNKFGGFGDAPTFVMSEETYFKGTNFNAWASYLGVKEYYTFATVYEDEANISKDLAAYLQSLYDVGYEHYSGSTLGIEEISVFKNNDDYAMNITIEWTAGKKEFGITVFVSDKVVTGTGISWAQFQAKMFSAKESFKELPALPSDLDVLEEVLYADMTEIQKGQMENITAVEVFQAAFFGLQYESDEQAMTNAKRLAATYEAAGYAKNENFSFEEDGMVYFTLETSKYNIEMTILVEEDLVEFLYKVYEPIRS